MTAAQTRLPRRRRDRRAALSALALLLVALGALGSALVVYRSGHRTDVLVAKGDIQVGQRVSASDFETTRVASDGGNVIAASAVSQLDGWHAVTTIPAGTLVNGNMFQKGGLIPSDGVKVGVTLTQDQRPAEGVQIGDVVRAYAVSTTGTSGNVGTSQELVPAARVVSVSDPGSGGTLTVTLLVTQKTAPQLIEAAGQGQVALAELPPSTTLPIDFQTSS